MSLYVLLAIALGVVAGWSAYVREQACASSLITGVIVFFIFGGVNYLFLPTLNLWGYDAIWIEFTIASIIGVFVSSSIDDEEGTFWRFIPLIICLCMLCVRIGSSAKMFHAEEYSKLLKPQKVEDSLFVNMVHPIPVEKMISVKREYAKDLASKRIENIPSLGSRCKFGGGDMINLDGSFAVKTAEGNELTLNFENEKVWVLPLEHSGLLKWRKNGVTDGYAIVSAHDPNRIFFITEVNGEALKLRYLESAGFGDNIERYVRTHGYASYGLTDFSMELDDSGKPYWVITMYEPTIGFGGEEAKGVLIVDMQTGLIEEYGIAETPSWVDLIQPKDLVYTQINDWGKFKLGFWNGLFEGTDVNEATPGMSLVYSEGKSYWYSGIQSSGADKSSSGFMLIDTRTKEATHYSVAGINEQAARDVIEAQSEWVRMSKFSANEAVLYNVHGVPTYYMTLTGDGIKNAGYAFVSLKNELYFAAESTPQKALQSYLKVLQNGNQFMINDGDKIAEEVVEFTVKDIVFENDTYYVLFNEVKGKEFIGTSDAFPEIKWTKIGQKVNVSYTNTEALVISLNSYDIVDFEI